MSLLGTSWHGTVFSDGWTKPDGGDAAVIAPATGEEIGRIGVASPADVARAAQSAAAAQEKWAATPYTERAKVLRRAGHLWDVHAAEVGEWLVREPASTPRRGGVEPRTAAQECYEAAALASHSLGEVLPSAQPRLSL